MNELSDTLATDYYILLKYVARYVRNGTAAVLTNPETSIVTFPFGDNDKISKLLLYRYYQAEESDTRCAHDCSPPCSAADHLAPRPATLLPASLAVRHSGAAPCPLIQLFAFAMSAPQTASVVRPLLDIVARPPHRTATSGWPLLPFLCDT